MISYLLCVSRIQRKLLITYLQSAPIRWKGVGRLLICPLIRGQLEQDSERNFRFALYYFVLFPSVPEVVLPLVGVSEVEF
jgi:hypothetical protein